jgi:hypothetical protein
MSIASPHIDFAVELHDHLPIRRDTLINLHRGPTGTRSIDQSTK